MTSREKKKVEELLREALDEDVDEQEQQESVSSLGIDVSRLAARLRQQVADHDAAERRRRWREADQQRQEELRRFATSTSQEPGEQLALPALLDKLRGLLNQAGPAAAGMHFMKFENATEEDVQQAIRAVQHLLKEQDGDK